MGLITITGGVKIPQGQIIVGAAVVSNPGNSLWSWGRNQTGQLGQENTTYLSSPVQVGNLVDWATSMEAGDEVSFTIKPDGTLWAWGSGQLGRHGLGDTNDRSSPSQVGSLTDWARLSAGNSHTHAIKTDGSLWGWGLNNVGRLGDSTTDQHRSAPIQIGNLYNWSKITVGASHSTSIKTDGTLWSWGFGSNGRLGHGNTTTLSSPVQIGILSDWVSVSAGDHNLAIKTDKTLWSWGRNTFAQLGTNDTDDRSSPVPIGSDTDWANVFAAESHSLAIKLDGSLWSWGSGTIGALGHGNNTSLSSPVQVGSDTNWVNAEGGNASTIALKSDGTLWTWGSNQYGKLGIGFGFGTRSSPVQIGTSTNWLGIGTGKHHMFGVKEEF